MDERPANGRMSARSKAALVLWGLVAVFAALAVVFALKPWNRSIPLYPIALVDPAFLDTATNRRSYADLVRAKDDLSDFDCYACHDRGKPPTLRFDEHQNLIIPREHSDIVMGHGEQGRNNNCFNCHNENNLELLQTRDGRVLKFQDSPQLCGSCHGPTYEDWEAGAHGRISGYWNRSLGPIKRQDCVNCHNPHAPTFQGRKPAPGPHPLHLPEVKPTDAAAH
jgi:formate-dependent nitrite reductase cytochrome c552 subunit